MAGMFGAVDYGTEPPAGNWGTPRREIDRAALGLPNITGNPGGTTTGGLIPGPDWLHQPGDAVFRAMRMAGYNPSSFSPFSKAVQANASNLQAQLMQQSFGGDPAFPLADITNNDAMLQSLANLIKQGGQGRSVLGGGSRGTLEQMTGAQHLADQGTMNPAVNAFAEYMSDPARAIKMTSNMLYGGLHPAMQDAAKAPLANLADYYARMLEQRPEDPRNILDVLLGTGNGPAQFQSWQWQ